MKLFNMLRDFLILQIRVQILTIRLDLINNREDLKKWLLATSEYENEIQEYLNAIVGYDEIGNLIILLLGTPLILKIRQFFEVRIH